MEITPILGKRVKFDKTKLILRKKAMLMKNEPILRSHRRAEPPGVRAVSGEMREVERKEEIMMAPTTRRDFFRGENYQKSEGSYQARKLEGKKN